MYRQDLIARWEASLSYPSNESGLVITFPTQMITAQLDACVLGSFGMALQIQIGLQWTHAANFSLFPAPMEDTVVIGNNEPQVRSSRFFVEFDFL